MKNSKKNPKLDAEMGIPLAVAKHIAEATFASFKVFAKGEKPQMAMTGLIASLLAVALKAAPSDEAYADLLEMMAAMAAASLTDRETQKETMQ